MDCRIRAFGSHGPPSRLCLGRPSNGSNRRLSVAIMLLGHYPGTRAPRVCAGARPANLAKHCRPCWTPTTASRSRTSGEVLPLAACRGLPSCARRIVKAAPDGRCLLWLIPCARSKSDAQCSKLGGSRSVFEAGGREHQSRSRVNQCPVWGFNRVGRSGKKGNDKKAKPTVRANRKEEGKNDPYGATRPRVRRSEENVPSGGLTSRATEWGGGNEKKKETRKNRKKKNETRTKT